MSFANKLEKLYINIVDKRFGTYQYYKGRKNKGKLSHIANNKNIFYLMAPSFGNIGDEAIVEASLSFFNDFYFEYNVVVIDYNETYSMLKEIGRVIKSDDIIFLQGGGNIGTLYYEAEIMREFIIRKFPNNKIISMPQSMYFSNDLKGKRRLKRSIKIYNNHKDLTLIAREKYSYDSMRNYYSKCNVLLNPDIVFYYSVVTQFFKDNDRKGIMTLLRADKESILSNKRIDIINRLFENFNDVYISDTYVGRPTPKNIRKYEVQSLLRTISKMKLIVTDRLHGMVFAAITNTPCIVMPSLDNKVLGTYEWISNLDYISFVKSDRTNDVIDLVDEILNSSHSEYEWEEFRKKYYFELRQRIEKTNKE